jgi:phosphinothricin acetyltransferase
VEIRLATVDDAAGIARVYNHAIEHTIASFWTEPRPPEEIAAQVERAGSHPWVVADDGSIAGVAWSKPWNPRQAYDRTVEVSVYVDPGRHGRGVGRALYEDLFRRLAELGYRHVIGGIALPNPGSVALHEAMVMRHVGTFERVGVKFGREIDVGYWQGDLSSNDSNN